MMVFETEVAFVVAVAFLTTVRVPAKAREVGLATKAAAVPSTSVMRVKREVGLMGFLLLGPSKWHPLRIKCG